MAQRKTTVEAARDLREATLALWVEILRSLLPDGYTVSKQEPRRCPLCDYLHGHRIGCKNNPVDIAMLAAAPQPKKENV